MKLYTKFTQSVIEGALPASSVSTYNNIEDLNVDELLTEFKTI